MSDETLLQQAKALARKSTLSAGATMDGEIGEAHLAVGKTWRNGFGISAYAKTLLAKGKKPTTAAGVEVTKSL
tara:strand:+ start:7373 stop:7591 length:219 start_codon:yes stop_codon:yes gene_type:complete